MRAHATLLALALLLPPAPVGSGGVANGDAASAAISITSPSPGWARRAEWGLERFAIAGLTLPRMTVTVHGDTAACDGNSGLYRPRDPVEIHLCSPGPVESRAARLITLHELAHAWAETQLTLDQREAFLRLRGLGSWSDDRRPPHEWGAEHAAEVVSWGLMDEPVRIIRIYDADPPELATAFDLLVGRAPLWDGHAGRVAGSVS